MCGLAGVIGYPEPGAATLAAMQGALAHRGPDGAGEWSIPGVHLVHRRLAVINPGPGGRQPMRSDDGRLVLAYNGELYNDATLRARLGGNGFKTSCDTETLLRWLSAGGPLDALRGMYAFAAIDTRARTLVLARDPFGIKPLFWARLPGRVLFASEIPALFEHPELSPEPDIRGVSAYLTTIRTVTDGHTMFAGVMSLRPGESLRFDLDDPDAEPARTTCRIEPAETDDDPERLRGVIAGSVFQHLRTDVPLCALLSGGLDSSVIAATAAERLGPIRTYCSGVDEPGADAGHARRAAAAIGTDHREAFLDAELFTELWQDSVSRTGLPMSTPNEAAIRLIARRLRADGCVVTLSGEGADEVFAGYDAPLLAAAGYESSPDGPPGAFTLRSNAWILPELKGALLTPEWSRGVEGDEWLLDTYERLFAEVSAGARSPLDRHLRFQRRVNLEGLLGRLDSATMLESVEGRTPFADREVVSAADGLPFGALFDPAGQDGPRRTKLALRAAFAREVPREVLDREKASFPVPFWRWMHATAARVTRNRTAAWIFTPAVLATIRADPGRCWGTAWPVLNVCLWAERWWGDAAQASAAWRRGTAESRPLVYSCAGSYST